MIPEVQKGSRVLEKAQLIIGSLVPIQQELRGTLAAIIIFLSQENTCW